MATMQSIITAQGRLRNYKIKVTSTQEEKIFSDFAENKAYFKDGTDALLDVDNYELVPAPKLEGKAKHLQKKDYCLEIMDDFEGENLKKVEDGVWPQNYITEMLADADFQEMARLCSLGVLEGMYSVAAAKTANATWFDSDRKAHYVQRLLDGVTQFSAS